MTTSSSGKSGLSYRTSAVLIAVVGICGWVVHGALVGADPVPQASLAAADGTAQAGDPPPVYMTVPPAEQPPIVVMLAPAGEAGSAQGGAREGGLQGARQQASPRSGSPRQGGAGAGTGGAAAVAPSASYTVVPRGGSPTRTDPATAPPGAVVYVVRPQGSTDRPRNAAEQTDYRVLAADGAIVHIGRGDMTANTGPTASSGVVALGVDGSDLRSGRSTVAAGEEASHANGSFQGLLEGSGGKRSAAVSGFEDHSVSVIGDDQIVTYDDSNVFVDRDGQINANTGDTDSSGLNAAVVVNSRVWAGNSGDAEGDDEEEEEGAEEEDPEDGELVEAGEEPAGEDEARTPGRRPGPPCPQHLPRRPVPAARRSPTRVPPRRPARVPSWSAPTATTTSRSGAGEIATSSPTTTPTSSSAVRAG